MSLQCRTMLSQRPCGIAACTREDCHPKPARLGDIPIPVVFTRDQVRLIRGMIATTAIGGELLPMFAEVKDVLDSAEDAATIRHTSRR